MTHSLLARARIYIHSLTQKTSAGKAHVANVLLEKLCQDHVDVLVLLLSARAQETEMLSTVCPHLPHPLTQPVHRHGKVGGRVEEL